MARYFALRTGAAHPPATAGRGSQLARWSQHGEPAMAGVSTALHRDGRLADVM
ncbi:hypothetical protein OG440_36375 [Streptomyces sp. NBC_00637]|uniref:hypothetical protein n=1 Tax=Streptomyces sp. NBC_00637 TaxID=2903667 RepID=UPI00324FF06D